MEANPTALEAPQIDQSWFAAMRGFGLWQQAANQSPGTIRLYRYKLLELAEQIPTPQAVTTPQLVEILANPVWSPATRKSVKGCWSSFFGWAHAAGVLPTNPALGLPRITVPRKLPRPAPDRIIDQALEVADRRIELMLMLAAYGGLRACEIARVHASDVQEDLLGYSLHVVGKGGKERWVPLDGDLLDRLLELDDCWAFPNRYHPKNHITPGYVSYLLSKALPGEWTAHTLRHRMATTVYAATGDLLALMELLGHSRPETTMQYTKVPGARIRAAAAAAMPPRRRPAA